MRRLVIAILLSACGGGGAPPNVDANPLGPLCSKQLYDLCTEEHDCETSICQAFPSFQVCSQSCDANNPCPADKSGAAGTCDNNACRPSAPNMCHLPGQ
ncbi:MAG TPA: hypothetical protein VIV40_10705 [Kofleriaceae bacterium]